MRKNHAKLVLTYSVIITSNDPACNMTYVRNIPYTIDYAIYYIHVVFSDCRQIQFEIFKLHIKFRLHKIKTNFDQTIKIQKFKS